MQILLTNDDGIWAEGLWALARRFQYLGKVTVVAPDREQSATGTAVSLSQPVRAYPVTPRVRGVEAYAVEGYPCDSVIVALERLLGEVDIVVSGINHGPNVGDDVFISGTVGAAMQAYFRSLPAIAVSTFDVSPQSFVKIAGVVERLVAIAEATRRPGGYLLNLNFPRFPQDKIRGVMSTRLAHRTHLDTVEEDCDQRGKCYRLKRTQASFNAEQGTDIWALEQGYISLTALHRFLFDEDDSTIEGLCLSLWQGLCEKAVC